MSRPNWREVITWAVMLTMVAGLGAREQSPPQPPRSNTPDSVLARLRQNVGVSPLECGRHARPASLTPPDGYADALTASVRCVIDAAAMRRPSWMFVELQGIDSWVSTGLVSGADGVVQRFFYDSDPSGGSGAEPYVQVTPCEAPAVSRRNGGASLECSTTPAGR